MGNVERGNTVIARAAARVLGGEVERAANGASVVESFGPSVTEQRCQIGSETLGDFAADSVVVPYPIRFQELDSRRSPLRKWHALDDGRISRKRLARVQQVGQMAALGTIETNLQIGRLTKCALDVEHILHAVSGRQTIVDAPSKSDRQLSGQRGSVDEI